MAELVDLCECSRKRRFRIINGRRSKDSGHSENQRWEEEKCKQSANRIYACVLANRRHEMIYLHHAACVCYLSAAGIRE